jgi:hypothetical protein
MGRPEEIVRELSNAVGRGDLPVIVTEDVVRDLLSLAQRVAIPHLPLGVESRHATHEATEAALYLSGTTHYRESPSLILLETLRRIADDGKRPASAMEPVVVLGEAIRLLSCYGRHAA